MESEDLAAARERLLAERERVTSLVREVRADFDGEGGEGSQELSNYSQHLADNGSDTFEREKDLSILDTLEAELAEIEAAIARVDTGTYGVDQVTGRPIDRERLRAVPSARTNIEPQPDGRVEHPHRRPPTEDARPDPPLESRD